MNFEKKYKKYKSKYLHVVKQNFQGGAGGTDDAGTNINLTENKKLDNTVDSEEEVLKDRYFYLDNALSASNDYDKLSISDLWILGFFSSIENNTLEATKNTLKDLLNSVAADNTRQKLWEIYKENKNQTSNNATEKLNNQIENEKNAWKGKKITLNQLQTFVFGDLNKDNYHSDLYNNNNNELLDIYNQTMSYYFEEKNKQIQLENDQNEPINIKVEKKYNKMIGGSITPLSTLLMKDTLEMSHLLPITRLRNPDGNLCPIFSMSIPPTRENDDDRLNCFRKLALLKLHHEVNNLVVLDKTILDREKDHWTFLGTLKNTSTTIFTDLKFQDMTPGTIDIYRNFHTIFIDLPRNNNTLCVHCLAGFGRTGSMLLFYILYNLYDTSIFSLTDHITIHNLKTLMVQYECRRKQIAELFNTTSIFLIDLLIRRLNLIRLTIAILSNQNQNILLYKLPNASNSNADLLQNDTVNFNITDYNSSGNHYFLSLTRGYLHLQDIGSINTTGSANASQIPINTNNGYASASQIISSTNNGSANASQVPNNTNNGYAYASQIISSTNNGSASLLSYINIYITRDIYNIIPTYIYNIISNN